MDFLKDFGVQPILLAAQVANFFVLLFILKKLLYKPILKVLEERKKRIEDSLKNAEEIEQRLIKTEEDREKILAKATSDAQKILDEVRKERDAIREEGRQMVAAEAALIIKKAQDEAKQEKEKMMDEVKGEVGKLVFASWQKVLGKGVPSEKQKEVIEQGVKELS